MRRLDLEAERLAVPTPETPPLLRDLRDLIGVLNRLLVEHHRRPR